MLLLYSVLLFLALPLLVAGGASALLPAAGAIAAIVVLASRRAGRSLGGGLWYDETGGAAMELLLGFVTAPSTTQTALTMATGDSLQLRATGSGKNVRLLAPWTDQQSAGSLRIRSPRLHDNNQGIRLRSVASEVYPLWGLEIGQKLGQNDTLAVDLSGSATAGDIETAVLPILYEDLDGANAKFITVDELQRRAVNLLAIENTLALGTAGGWSGSEAINAEYDPMIANTDYALIGFNVDTECAAIGWRGADTSNYRLGGPGHETNKQITRDWFIRLSKALGIALIPVFNSNNRAAIQIDGAQDENGADPLVNSIFVQLAPR